MDDFTTGIFEKAAAAVEPLAAVEAEVEELEVEEIEVEESVAVAVAAQ